jgi:thiamine biosynthesis lipoprotein
MGTTFSIALHGDDAGCLEAAAEAAFGELRRLDRLLSPQRPDSEWSLINREAARHAVAVSPESFRLLSTCVERSRQTSGAFDITVGPLKSAWGFQRGTVGVPSADALAAVRAHVGYGLVELDPTHETVRFDRPGVEIDPGGVGKGYAVDCMVAVLRRRGVASALISGARSSIAAIGVPAGGGSDGWRAEIRDPEHPATTIAHAVLRDASLSTSGTIERAYWAGSQMYSDIIDPRTGWPLQSIGQVSIVTALAFDGEVWAKACLLNGPRWASEHKPEGSRVLFWRAGGGDRPSWV